MGICKLIKSVTFGSFTNPYEYKKHPFYLLRNDKRKLIKHKNMLLEKMIHSGASLESRQLFEIAFDYFVENYEKYDGASGDVELHLIDGYRYDIGAIEHDYPDVTNYTTTKERIALADKALIKIMEEIGDPSFHIDKRKLVTLAKVVRYQLSRKRRKQSPTHINGYNRLLNNYVRDYKIDYTPIYKYGAILAVILYLVLSNDKTYWIFKTIINGI